MGCAALVAVLALRWVLVLGHAGSSYQLQQYDSLRVARCAARCWQEQEPRKEACVNTCLETPHSKPGACPAGGALSLFDVACIEACTADSECSGTAKCCAHDCGVTCQRAQGLDNVTGLPPVPVNLTAAERRHGRTVLLEWGLPNETASPPPLLYLLEERHHVGRHLTIERLGAWVTRHRSTRPTATLKNVLRPGRWYQFRVAAVNANGSRGFSEPSEAFKLSLAPKSPGPPLNLTVSAIVRVNGTLRGELRWQPPASDLPVQRYKVFWSRRLQGASTATSQVSVLVNHQTVSGDVTRFLLKALEPDSLYFLQVQAMTQFGRDRLKGEKASMIFNTGDHKNVTEISTLAPEGGGHRSVRRVEGLRVQKVFWAQGQLMASTSWQRLEGATRYTVTWLSAPCEGEDTSSQDKVQLAATTDVPKFDLYGLNFQCKYRVTVHVVTPDDAIYPHEASVIFTTPTCEAVASSSQDRPQCSTSANDKPQN